MSVLSWFLIFTLALSLAKAENPAGVTDKEVIVGAHVSGSGYAAYSNLYSQAVAAYFEEVNKAGGVEGRKIKWVTIDSQGLEPKTVQAVKTLVEEEKVLAIVGAQGGSHFAILKYLIENSIPDIFFTDFNSAYATPPKKGIYPAWFTNDVDSNFHGKYIVENFQGKKACTLTLDNSNGDQWLKGVQEAINAYNSKASAEKKVTFAASEKVDKVATHANEQVLKLKKAGCDVVVNITAATLGPKVINFAHQQGFKPTWTTFWSNTRDNFLSVIDAGARDGILATTAFANVEGFKVPNWNKYKEFCQRNKIELDPVSARGFYIGEIFVEALKKAGKKLTRESLIAAVESLNGFKCSLCIDPIAISKDQHAALIIPHWVVSKGGKWVPK